MYSSLRSPTRSADRFTGSRARSLERDARRAAFGFPDSSSQLDPVHSDSQTWVLTPAALVEFVAANLPIIPTTTASQWFQYNSQNYVGWPTPDNPYESGQPSGTNNGPGSGTDEVVLLHLRPRA